LMAVEGKECEECGDVIPTERQIASPLSAYCASCQAWVEETTKRRKLLSA
jgi:RNA polymerase-binding transcription factor DksA